MATQIRGDFVFSGVATGGGTGGTRPPYSAESTRGIRAKPKSFLSGVGGRGCHEIINKSS